MKTQIMITALVLIFMTSGVYAWGNGFSIYGNPTYANSVTFWTNADMYGTHDYLAEKAYRMLKEVAPEEADWINTRYLFYGTELPDSHGYDESIDDRSTQVLEFDSQGRLVDNDLALRSIKRYDTMISALARGETGTASKWVGVTMSYISDAGLFSRVISDPLNGKRFEDHILVITDIVYPSEDFESTYGGYISFDGQLEMISPYDAVARLGQMTYLGNPDGSCSAQWMDDNYDLYDPQFIDCAGRNFNDIVNAEVDVMHTIYQAAVNNKTYELRAYDWSSYIYEPGAPSQEETQVPTTNDSGENSSIPVPPQEVSPSGPSEAQANETPIEEDIDEVVTEEDNNSWLYAILVIVAVAIVVFSFKMPKGGKQDKTPDAEKKKSRTAAGKGMSAKPRTKRSMRTKKR